MTVNVEQYVLRLDWRRFRKEGADYLRRLTLPEIVAAWAASRMYVLDWQRFTTGARWNSTRRRWERPETTQRLDAPGALSGGALVYPALHPRRGKRLPPSMAPRVCGECGGDCAFNANLCRKCWDKIRPRKRKAVNDERDGCGA